MSYRRLWVLLNRLPQDSWTQTALRDEEPGSTLIAPAAGVGPQFGPWALEHYQLASVLDAVRHLTFVLAKVNGNDWPVPDPTPRPGLRRAVRRKTAAAVEYLDRLRARAEPITTQGGDPDG